MISVLRLGHRLPRDQRISTHLGLVARQFGAEEFIFTGDMDSSLVESLRKTDERWGKRLVQIRHEQSWRRVVEMYRERGFVIVHLTMYGIPLDRKIGEITGKDILVIVGGEKVPGEVFDIADYNISVGSQPHSEVAALAIFLDRLVDWKSIQFRGKIEVVPSERGKLVRKNK